MQDVKSLTTLTLTNKNLCKNGQTIMNRNCFLYVSFVRKHQCPCETIEGSKVYKRCKKVKINCVSN